MYIQTKLAELLTLAEALDGTIIRDCTTQAAINRTLQDISITESKVVIIKFALEDHGVQPYDIFQCQNLSLEKCWMGLCHDKLSKGYGRYMIVQAYHCVDLILTLAQIFAMVPVNQIEEFRTVQTVYYDCWPKLPLDVHPGQVYWAKDNCRIPASYFKNPEDELSQVFGYLPPRDLSFIINVPVPGYLIGQNDNTFYKLSSSDGFTKMKLAISQDDINIEQHIFHAISRQFIGFLSQHDWQAINYMTNKPHQAIQSDLNEARRSNQRRLAYVMNRLSLPNDKLILVNGLKYSPKNLEWESKHTPKDRSPHNNKKRMNLAH